MSSHHVMNCDCKIVFRASEDKYYVLDNLLFRPAFPKMTNEH